MNYQQILGIVEELKREVKKTKQKYCEIPEIGACYRIVKRVHSAVKQSLEKKEKLPDFFSKLHVTTVEMRQKLLEELNKEKQKNRQTEEDYQNILKALKNSLVKKDQAFKNTQEQLEKMKDQVLSLQRKLKNHKQKKDVIDETNPQEAFLQQLRGQNKKLKRIQDDYGKMKMQNDSHKKQIQKLQAKLQQKSKNQEILKNQLKQLKEIQKINKIPGINQGSNTQNNPDPTLLVSPSHSINQNLNPSQNSNIKSKHSPNSNLDQNHHLDQNPNSNQNSNLNQNPNTKKNAYLNHDQVLNQNPNQMQNKAISGFSPSPDKNPQRNNLLSEAKTLYENAYGSFSEIPTPQNFTSFENTFSYNDPSNPSQRKIKSLLSPRQKNKQADELWRFIYIQANAIQQFLLDNEDNE